MKHVIFSKHLCYTLLLLIGFLSACSYKKVDPQDQACFTYTLLTCEGNGLKFRLNADCCIDNPNDFQWEIEGTKLSGQTVDYVFTQEKDYEVSLVVKGGDFTDEIKQTINARKSAFNSFAKASVKQGRQESQAIAAMLDGSGYVVCGYFEEAGTTKCFLSKFDNNGSLLWHKLYGYQQSNETKGYGVLVEADGTIVVAGNTIIGSKQQVYLFKVYNSDGTVVPSSEKVIQSDNNQQAFYLSKSPNGGYLMCGHDYQHDTYGSGMIMKFDGNLNALSTPVFTNSVTKQIKSDGVNSYVAAGGVFLPTDNLYSSFAPLPYVGKWQDNSLYWEYRPTGFNPDKSIEIFSITPLSDGSYAICGSSEKMNENGKIYIGHISSAGLLINEWELSEGKVANDVIEASDGSGIVLAAVSSEGTYTDEKQDNSFLFKFSLESGAIVWRNDNAIASQKDNIYSVIPTLDCGYLGVGHAIPSNTGDLDVYLIKANLEGQ
jgi:hypothetical protein